MEHSLIYWNAHRRLNWQGRHKIDCPRIKIGLQANTRFWGILKRG